MSQATLRTSRPIWIGLAAVLLIALVGRVLLLASNMVSFHSDEAIVALMARHILQGERPVFFYGQAYMGSVDAWLISVGFALLGESVLTIRIVQSILYLVIVGVTYGLAWRITRSAIAAFVAGLWWAVAPVLVTLYTTATLGGYNETLLLGALLVWLTYEISENPRPVWRWGLLGVVAGLGWWANGLIVIAGIPAALLLLWRVIKMPTLISRAGLALLTFFIASAPWWVFALQNDLAPLRFFIGSSSSDSYAGTDVFSLPFGERVIGLFFLGFPALFGIRFPWLASYFSPVVGILIIIIALVAMIAFARRRDIAGSARWLLLGIVGLFCVIFLVSRFSSDPTGRYFLPIALPVSIMIGAFVATVRVRLLAVGITVLVIGYHAAGQLTAATGEYGLTTQFNLVTHLPNDDDTALIAFLEANNLRRGYTTYWVTYRLAFLSDERLIYRAVLPYKPDLTYTPLDERYRPYVEAVERAQLAGEPLAFITANVPEVDRLVEAQLAEAGVSYSTEEIGIYRVYYELTPIENVPELPFTNSD